MTYSLQIPSIMHKAVFGNLIDDWMTNSKRQLSNKRRSFPITDVYRSGDNQIIEMALAGYPKDSIKIETKSNQIKISSEGITNDRESNIARRAFSKTFIDYNNELNLSDAKAEFKNGLLIITINQKENTKPINIKIQ